MSQADIEMLRAGYEAVNRGDRETAFREAHPDFELTTADRAPNAGIYRGVENATAFLDDLFEPFDEVVTEPEEFFEQGDRIVAFVRVRSRPRGSTAVVDNRIAHVWTMRDGKALAMKVFPDREKALESVGLSK
jgi:uncharacterized protein